MKKKELYLYTGIVGFVAEDLISKMDEVDGEDIVIRVSSPGGDVMAAWGIIAKMQERDGKVDIKVDGCAFSMAGVMTLFADRVECLDVSKFMFHKGYMSGTLTPQQQAFVDNANKDLRAKMEEKIDTKLLKQLTGYSIRDLFEKEERVDLFLNAQQAKQLGLVAKVNKLKPAELQAFNDKMYHIAAEHEEGDESKKKTKKTENKNNPKNRKNMASSAKMTVAKLKAKYPLSYKKILAEGAAEERDRVGAFLVFNEVDPKGIKTAIMKGEKISQTQMAEYGMKALAAKGQNDLENESAANVTTTEVVKNKTEKEKTTAEFQQKLYGELNLKLEGSVTGGKGVVLTEK